MGIYICGCIMVEWNIRSFYKIDKVSYYYSDWIECYDIFRILDSFL